jgi:hypothetical protein
MSQICCETCQCHKSQVPEGSRKGTPLWELGKWEHSVFDAFVVLTVKCFICFLFFRALAPPRPNPPVCLDQPGKQREGDQRQ